MVERVTLTWPAGSPTATSALNRGEEEIQALISRCLNGDEPAFAALYDMYTAMIYRLNYSLLQHKEDAEEVLQDCFEYAFRRLGCYDPQKAAFRTWLYQIAISRCRNKRRRKGLPASALSRILGRDATDPAAPAPEEVTALRDRQRLVWEALGRLSPKLRETAVLRYYEGLTYGQISRILGIPAKTAESRMRLAHKALRKWLAEFD
jgi:RNA polymerase sigma-70 factor (ECF subfamily)